MKLERIGLHKLHIYSATYNISTVRLPEGVYETLVYDPKTGDDLDCIRSSTLEEAKRTHVLTMRRWNDKAYEGSIDKCLHFANLGQFVKPVICPDVVVE